jgi:hypothetical protein
LELFQVGWNDPDYQKSEIALQVDILGKINLKSGLGMTLIIQYSSVNSMIRGAMLKNNITN